MQLPTVLRNLTGISLINYWPGLMMLCQKRKAISQNEIRSNAYRYPQNAYFVSNEKLTPEKLE